ncbi:MAG: ribose 5-phosphate isomerase B [Elusimicrobiaceae bacterium]|nr:ribose 5-phosphate isomerase B [Elusimicrobiaceae bacterium]
MKVALGCDHAGFAIKDIVKKTIEDFGAEVLDFGTFSSDSVDYPDFAAKVALAVSKGEAQKGILICGSGIGVCITANKFKGVRASIAHDEYSAEQGVLHDNMNVLCLGARVVKAEIVPSLVKAFLGAEFQAGEERHARRCGKVLDIEKQNFK